jgi:hypothetical protein
MDLIKQAELINTKLTENAPSADRIAAAKKFNLSKAVSRIRSAKHDIQNAIVAVLTGLKQIQAYADKEHHINYMISLVRRDEEKERSWVDWLNSEVNTLNEDLEGMGYSLSAEFPEEFSKIENAKIEINKYLTHFQLGKPDTNISDDDRKSIIAEANQALDAFKTFKGTFQDMTDKLNQKYGL